MEPTSRPPPKSFVYVTEPTPESEEVDRVIKAVIGGDTGVGKSSILLRLQQGQFKSNEDPTIGVQFVIHTLNTADGVAIKFQCWDTAGQDRFRSIVKSYFKNARLLIFVFDIGSRPSYANLPLWFKESGWQKPKGEAHYACAYSQHTLAYLIGNKCDVRHREVTSDEAEEFALQHDMHYLEMSAKTGENVKEAFLQITNHVHTYHKIIQMETEGQSTFLSSDPLSAHTNDAHEDGDEDIVLKSDAGCCCFRRRNTRERSLFVKQVGNGDTPI